MLLLGYWSVWFFICSALSLARKIRFTDGNGNSQFSTVIVYSFVLAVPSSIIHVTFKDLRFLLVVFVVIGVLMLFKSMLQKKYQIRASQQTVMNYAEQLWDSSSYDELFDEMYRGDGYNEKKMLKFIDDMAKKHGVTLTSKNDVDEDALFKMYKTAEKGLS